jgi:AraC-like DNA-binding protein/quercetin dioxygenase-like cupin family protein
MSQNLTPLSHASNFLWQSQNVVRGKEIIHCVFSTMNRHASLSLLIRQEQYHNGLDTGLHRHEDFYALYVVQAGQGMHIIDNHPYMITRGDVYILPPGSVHAYQNFRDLTIDAFYFQPSLFYRDELVALERMSSFWHLIIPAEIVSDASDTVNVPKNSSLLSHSHRENRQLSYDHRFHVSPECYHELLAMIEEIRAEFFAASLEATLLTRNQFFRMLVYIARQYGLAMRGMPQMSLPSQDRLDTSSRRDEPLDRHSYTPHGIGLARVLQLCEERFYEPLTVPQLAALMFLSPSRFTEIFTQQVGVSPAAYIRRLRLERAQTLLRTSTYSISTIAQQVGFGDSAQFTRAFQAVFHMTPTAYRGQFKSS